MRLGQTFDMTRGDGGVWSVTLPPQGVGFHYYYLVIDGIQVNDPASEAFYGVNRESSGIEIPEKGVDYYEPKAGPTAKSDRGGTTPKSPENGGAVSYTRRRTTIRT